ncbi:MAG: hypothetical protein ABI480_08920 [Chitinophagaceae bacterium]
METMQQSLSTTHFQHAARTSVFKSFFDWCQAQEESRLLWVGVIIAGHGCVITPLTSLLIVFSGNSIILWSFAIAAMTMALVVNLAALPTKITLPVFALSLLMDIAVVAACVTSLVNN